MKNPLVLAYIGDTVYDLYVRMSLCKGSEGRVNALNHDAISKVNARAQAEMADKLYGKLTEREQEIYRRGRNAKPATMPRNMGIGEYRKATALEAVIGYLFLCGAYARLEELMGAILEQDGQAE